MNTKRFCILENWDLWGTPLVLDLHTLIVGCPYCFKNDQQDEIEQRMKDMANDKYPIAKMPGYSIFFTVKMSLSSERFDNNALKDILAEMAEFYLHYKVETKPGKFQRCRDDYYPGMMRERSSWSDEQIQEHIRRKRIKRGEL